MPFRVAVSGPIGDPAEAPGVGHGDGKRPAAFRHGRREQGCRCDQILDDRGNAYARRLGLINELPDYLQALYEGFGVVLPEHNADGTWALPVPARFVVDRAGIIRHAAFNADYTRRPEPSELLDQLAELRPGAADST